MMTTTTNDAAIRVQPIICDDQCDRDHYGQAVGVSFFAGTEAAAIEMFIPARSNNPHDVACVYTANDTRITLDELEQLLPVLTTLLNDPRVQHARNALHPA